MTSIAIDAIRSVCDEHQLGLHLDGARLWNALVASGQDAKSYGALFDTISVCFSKGLGAPVGSALIGSKAAMEQALRVRKDVWWGNAPSRVFGSSRLLMRLTTNGNPYPKITGKQKN